MIKKLEFFTRFEVIVDLRPYLKSTFFGNMAY